MLVISIFSFSNNTFERLFHHTFKVYFFISARQTVFINIVGKGKKSWLPAFYPISDIVLFPKKWKCNHLNHLNPFLNPFPHNKILDLTKLKAFADEKLNVSKMIISVFDSVESRKHCGKRRNCLYKQFLLFPQCFQKASFPEVSKGVIVWEWVNTPIWDCPKFK